jgi:BMFP domain-containing protein YqiC
LCNGTGDALACRPVPDSGQDGVSATVDDNARIAALEARVAALEGRSADKVPALTEEESIDRVADLAEKVMRRFFAMVRDMKRELDGEQL